MPNLTQMAKKLQVGVGKVSEAVVEGEDAGSTGGDFFAYYFVGGEFFEHHNEGAEAVANAEKIEKVKEY